MFLFFFFSCPSAWLYYLNWIWVCLGEWTGWEGCTRVFRNSGRAVRGDVQSTGFTEIVSAPEYGSRLWPCAHGSYSIDIIPVHDASLVVASLSSVSFNGLRKTRRDASGIKWHYVPMIRFSIHRFVAILNLSAQYAFLTRLPIRARLHSLPLLLYRSSTPNIHTAGHRIPWLWWPR